MKTIIYSDGSCINGKGAYCGLILLNNNEKWIFGKEENTTNNRMELMAVIKSLEFLENTNNIIVFTDSKYVQQGITEWINNWQKNGWKTTNNKEVLNKDLWQNLLFYKIKISFEIQWIPAHTNKKDIHSKYNDMVDKKARSLINNKV